MAIQRAEAFNPNNMESYLAYTRTQQAAKSSIEQLGDNGKKIERKVDTETTRAAMSDALTSVLTPANATIEALIKQINDLQAPAQYSEVQAGGGKKTIISGREGMDILLTDGSGKKVEDRELLADGTEIVTIYKNGEPAERFTTNPDGTKKTPEHYNVAEGKWQEGDPVPVSAGKVITQEYKDFSTGTSKLYRQTNQQLTDGSTKITIESLTGDGEAYTITGKVYQNPRYVHADFTEITSSEYSCPQKGLKITTKDNVTTIEDDKKGVTIKMTPIGEQRDSWQNNSTTLKTEYIYKEGPVKSSTITGQYAKIRMGTDSQYSTIQKGIMNSSLVSWLAQKDVSEKVEFRDGSTATINYKEKGDAITSVDGFEMNDEAKLKEIGIKDSQERLLHISPTHINFKEGKKYLHPFGLIA